MQTEIKLCRNCGSPINQSMRKDAIFCQDPCRKAYWEKLGKRHEEVLVNGILPFHSSSFEIDVLKASDLVKISEVIENGTKSNGTGVLQKINV